MRTFPTLVVAGTLITQPLGSAIAANLILNGSFEAPIVSAGTPNLTTPNSWQGSGNYQHMFRGYYGPAEDGQQYAAVGNSSSLLQTVTISTPGTYTLSWFDCTEFNGQGQLSPYSVSIIDSNGNTVATANFDANAAGYALWALKSLQFTVNAAGLYTVRFDGHTNIFAEESLIDNVSLPGETTHIEFVPLSDQVEPSIRPRQYVDNNGTVHQYVLSPNLNAQTVSIKVTDSQGNPKPDVSVRVSIDGSNALAGHAGHVPAAVHGWIFGLSDRQIDDDGINVDLSTPVPPGGLGGSVQDSTLDLSTDSGGIASFQFVAAEVSGVDTVRAEVINESVSVTTNIVVGITSLLSMGNFVGYFDFSLFGFTGLHPQSWFALDGTIRGLRTVAQTYQANQASDSTIQDAIQNLSSLGYDFPNDIPHGSYGNGYVRVTPKDPEILFINDISLPWGGLFDINGDFTSPHGGHRDGSNVDLKSTHLVEGAPYLRISNGHIAQAARPSSAIGDDRLTGGTSPFSNADVYIGPNGRAVHYDDNIRKRMNHFVTQIHYERLLQLLDALNSAGCTFSIEENHIHVKFP